MSEIAEETEILEVVTKWEGTPKHLKTIYRNQVEVLVDKNDLPSLTEFLLADETFGWRYITSLSGMDYPERSGEELEVVYHFSSVTSPKIVVVKVRTSYEDPTVPSLYHITRSVDFHEREAFDMFGIRFLGHPRANDEGIMPRLLLPDDWPQYEDDPEFPFRKEYFQKPRPFERVTDTRGHQGKRWDSFHRPVDRSGWLDEYYKEETPIPWFNTKKPYRADTPPDEPTESEKPDETERKHF